MRKEMHKKCAILCIGNSTTCLNTNRSEFYQHYVGEGGKDRKKDKEAAEEEEETQIGQ